MTQVLDIEARISALELVVLTHILQSGLPDAAYDPKAFAAARREAWASIGTAMCDGCTSDSDDHRYTRAYGTALGRLGDLLQTLAEPVQEAMSEIAAENGETAQDLERE
ncbi:hypothetical protein [Novosphingobium sp. JCM 18896]|uniref:hypothetical protein n=1 Tax=Novosphingobium sp. JCM 18896 TaxID=2989731 RepID=UPI002221A3A4|nr:hypothetical protein [Novosphingobium sp. JCM 18896]MCW1430204.1 hypothetical protein [Novosphingobium sp. JCM 18896]